MPIVTNGPGAPVLGDADRPLAVAAVKQVLRATQTDDDALIAAFAETALGLAEQFCGQVWLRRSMTLIVAGGRSWRPLPARPVAAVTDAATVLPDGSRETLSPAGWNVDIDAEGGAFLRFSREQRAAVTLTAGLAEGWGALPSAIAEGVALAAAHLFDGATDPPPAAITALWRPYRMLRLTGETAA